MTPEQFCYWLQGYVEVSQAQDLPADKLQVVKDHLAQVFHKKTPDYVHPELNRLADDPQRQPLPYTPQKPTFIC